jgi:hypothetical protein
VSTEPPISSLISLAAAALRCASVRTSAATTAKPRPWSPARAASTAAFSARMLVWKAIPSITPMISEIFAEDAEIPFMVRTTWPTTSPPLRATFEASTASWLACCAWLAFCVTLEVSSSMEPAVSSSVLACSSVRCDRSTLPCAIWVLACATTAAPLVTSPTSWRRLRVMSPTACSSWPGSSRRVVRMSCERSPSATRFAASTAWPIGHRDRAADLPAEDGAQHQADGGAACKQLQARVVGCLGLAHLALLLLLDDVDQLVERIVVAPLHPGEPGEQELARIVRAAGVGQLQEIGFQHRVRLAGLFQRGELLLRIALLDDLDQFAAQALHLGVHGAHAIEFRLPGLRRHQEEGPHVPRRALQVGMPLARIHDRRRVVDGDVVQPALQVSQALHAGAGHRQRQQHEQAEGEPQFVDHPQVLEHIPSPPSAGSTAKDARFVTVCFLTPINGALAGPDERVRAPPKGRRRSPKPGTRVARRRRARADYTARLSIRRVVPSRAAPSATSASPGAGACRSDRRRRAR